MLVLPGMAPSVPCLAIVCPRRMFMYFLSVCLQVDFSFNLFPFEDLLPSYSDVVPGKDQSVS